MGIILPKESVGGEPSIILNLGGARFAHVNGPTYLLPVGPFALLTLNWRLYLRPLPNIGSSTEPIILKQPLLFCLMSTDPAKQARKRSIVSTLLYIEGAIVLSLGAWVAVMGITHEDREIPPLMGVLGFALLGGLGLIACGRAFAAEKNWGRAPVVLANLIVLGVVKYQFEGGFLIGAIPLLLLSVPILYLAITIIPNS